MKEVMEERTATNAVAVRRSGAGRRSVEEAQPGIIKALEELIEPTTRDHQSILRWTYDSTRSLSAKLQEKGYTVSQHKVGELLNSLGYSLQLARRGQYGQPSLPGDSLFGHINKTAEDFITRGQPVVAVATRPARPGEQTLGRKQEESSWVRLVNGEGLAPGPQSSPRLGADSPLIRQPDAHDTPVVVVNSVRSFWIHIGRQAYPRAREMLLSADHATRRRVHPGVWQSELERLAREIGLLIHLAELPRGTCKWSRVEHRLLSHLSLDAHDRPSAEYDVVVEVIGSPRIGATPGVARIVDRIAFER
jgi:hypothetical protein